MEYAILSRSDLRVSRIGFGCEPLGGSDWGPVDSGRAMEAVTRAFDHGINLFDTADVYGLGRSEELLSKALGPRRHEAVIVSKFGVNWRAHEGGVRAETFTDASPEHAADALENSLRRLRIDCIPLYLIHRPDPLTPLARTLEALVRFQEAGKIRHIGVSNFPPELLREACALAPITAVEMEFNLLTRAIHQPVLDCCRALGISVLAYGPLAQGLLSGKYSADSAFGPDDRRHRLPHFQSAALDRHLTTVERLKQLGPKYGKSPSQMAIRWVMDAPGVTTTIVSAKTTAQVDENLGASDWRLDDADYRALAGSAE